MRFSCETPYEDGDGDDSDYHEGDGERGNGQVATIGAGGTGGRVNRHRGYPPFRRRGLALRG